MLCFLNTEAFSVSTQIKLEIYNYAKDIKEKCLTVKEGIQWIIELKENNN